MAPPFKQLQPAEFVHVVQQFGWQPAKTLIHMHHTWRPNHSQYHGVDSIQAMYDYHVNTNHWSDIAQHVSLAPDGTIWTGRPWNMSPASAAGYNSSRVFMFETIGDFDQGKDPLTGAQLDTVVLVIATLMKKFDLSASALKFHNEMSTKSCPGSAVSKQDILDKVGEFINAGGSNDAAASVLSETRRAEIFEAIGAGAEQADAMPEDAGELPEHDPAYEAAILNSLPR
ncbi:peptidoglycan recognition family protein [Bradyrhizobium sp. CB1717]|uniref:peptidoglycan recognition protein family protein n=1 Tax=Bradyrhizobium sp. CB1717 TaxID=3039154 RepID=UPI0024B18075|nr:peptidoglycan recognition family protein [Bradyrhizobium sp. CB1717]WFU24405.1 peptidoglycan recognition family protein [Bradyrhizobium sp. CB1717]